MSMNKALLAAVIVLGSTSMAHAADQGSGHVKFSGTIIDAPCSIKPEAVNQTVEMGQISNAALQNGGQSTPRSFSIGLENCTFGTEESKNKARVTFTGMESAAKNGLLGITGAAKGASIAITDGSGAVIELGKPTAEQVLQASNNTLSFAAYMQGDGESATITEGDFQAVANFTLAYN